jgi:BirA family transcriptional regulator, biotin operon repressor / biotin---[acetyl-CoA-carboxylase] ligase
MNMSTLNHPSLLIDLGHVGPNGLPLNSAPWFQHEMQLCREWGFQLKTTKDRVSLLFDREQLVPYWIQQETPAIAWDLLRVKGFLRTSSTNSEAINLARKGAPSGTLVYAEEQLAGRGRKDRVWVSPPRTGLYLSLVVKPARPVQFWPILTHVASLALVQTLKDIYERNIIPNPLDIDLKWPNDMLLSGKKCAGILLESVAAEDESQAAIVGLGINVHEGSVPESLKSEAACLDEMTHVLVPRRQLLVTFLHQFQLCYLLFEQGKEEELLERWKAYSSMWNGVEVKISDGDASRTAKTCGLNEMGALLVRNSDGTMETILAGDIRISRA